MNPKFQALLDAAAAADLSDTEQQQIDLITYGFTMSKDGRRIAPADYLAQKKAEREEKTG